MPAGAPIKLTWYEVRYASMVGLWRQVAAWEENRKERFGAYEDAQNRWISHLEGACAEMAFAKLAGIYWDASVNTFSAPDVGLIQVRLRAARDPRLIIRDKDDDHEAFVLMTGVAPSFVAQGWIMGAEGKKAEWRSDPGGRGAPAYFVPATALRSIYNLSVIDKANETDALDDPCAMCRVRPATMSAPNGRRFCAEHNPMLAYGESK